jgi:hypothetical protein
MAPPLGLYPLLLVALAWIVLLSHLWWPDRPRAPPPRPLKPDQPGRKRSTAPPPFPGLLHPPLGEACEPGATAPRPAPGSPPPVVTGPEGAAGVSTRRRPLSGSGWLLCGLARPGAQPRPWTSRWPALAPAAGCLVPRLGL